MRDRPEYRKSPADERIANIRIELAQLFQRRQTAALSPRDEANLERRIETLSHELHALQGGDAA